MTISERFYYWKDKMIGRKGSRQSFQLWLDWNNPDDVELIKVIALLKDKQEFSKVMRMALKIIPAMMYESSLDELFSEFAWVKLEMLEYMRGLQGTQTNGVGDLRNEFERLERLILEQGNGKTDQGGLPPVTASPQPKQLDVPQVTAPIFEDEDDDLLVVKKDENAGFEAAQNFINSMLALQGQ